jgi:hypothetical protein
MFASRVIRGVAVPCVVVYVIVVLVIVLYGIFLRKTGTRDVLALQLFDHPICQKIDGWSVSHVVFFGLLGFLYPGRHLQFFVVGVFWEIIETALGQNKIEVSGKRLQLIGEQDETGASTGEKNAYWYGKESDIVMDAGAYAAGSYLAERYWPAPPHRRHMSIGPLACTPPPMPAPGAVRAARPSWV